MTTQLAPGTQFLATDGTYRVVEQDGSQSIIRPTPELKAQLDAQAGVGQPAAQQTVMPGAASAPAGGADFVPPADTPDPAAAQAARNPQGGAVDPSTGQVTPHAPAEQAPAQTAAPPAGQAGLGNIFGAGPASVQPEPLVAAGITTAGPPVGTAQTVEQTAAAVTPAPEAPAYAQMGGTSDLTDDLAATSTGVRVPRLKPHDMSGFVIEHTDKTLQLNTNQMEIVILAGGPKVKVMYPGAYQQGVKTKPICKSSNGVVPDADSPQPQCATCAACPHNQFGTHNKGKACKDRRRLAVIDLRDPNMVMQMDLPVMHTLALGDYAQHLARSKGSVEWAKTIVQSKRAEGMTWMELDFIFNGWLTEEEMAVIDRTKTEYDDLIRAATDPGGRASGANLIAQQAAPAQVTHVQQVPQANPAPQTVQAAAPAAQAAKHQAAGAAALGFPA